MVVYKSNDTLTKEVIVKKSLSIFLVLILTVVFSMGVLAEGQGEGSNGAGKTYKLNLGHTQILESHYGLMATKFAQLCDVNSDGRLIVTQYPSSQLGGEVQMIQAIRSGSLDLLITAQAPVENVVPEWAIFDVPYLFDSVEEANRVLADPAVAKKFMDMLPAYKMVGLSFMSVMERNIFGNVPIRTVDDIKGLKLRTLQAPGYVAGYEALGAAPTPMAYTEVLHRTSAGCCRRCIHLSGPVHHGQVRRGGSLL